MIPGLVLVIIHLAGAAHALKKGKDLWALAIILFPFFALTAYLFRALGPDMRSDKDVLTEEISPNQIPATPKVVRMLEEQVEINPSVQNKKNLADALVQQGNYRAAIDLYRSCLEGIYDNDPAILYGYAIASFLAGDYAETLALIERYQGARGNNRQHQIDLLKARTHQALGDTDQALEIYQAIAGIYPGEEARYRYGLLLKESGNTQAANQVFDELERNVKNSPEYYKDSQRRWISLTRKARR